MLEVDEQHLTDRWQSSGAIRDAHTAAIALCQIAAGLCDRAAVQIRLVCVALPLCIVDVAHGQSRQWGSPRIGEMRVIYRLVQDQSAPSFTSVFATTDNPAVLLTHPKEIFLFMRKVPLRYPEAADVAEMLWHFENDVLVPSMVSEGTAHRAKWSGTSNTGIIRGP